MLGKVAAMRKRQGVKSWHLACSISRAEVRLRVLHQAHSKAGGHAARTRTLPHGYCAL
jgi:hypothetical protein